MNLTSVSDTVTIARCTRKGFTSQIAAPFVYMPTLTNGVYNITVQGDFSKTTTLEVSSYFMASRRLKSRETTLETNGAAELQVIRCWFLLLIGLNVCAAGHCRYRLGTDFNEFCCVRSSVNGHWSSEKTTCIE